MLRQVQQSSFHQVKQSLLRQVQKKTRLNYYYVTAKLNLLLCRLRLMLGIRDWDWGLGIEIGDWGLRLGLGIGDWGLGIGIGDWD